MQKGSKLILNQSKPVAPLEPSIDFMYRIHQYLSGPLSSSRKLGKNCHHDIPLCCGSSIYFNLQWFRVGRNPTVPSIRFLKANFNGSWHEKCIADLDNCCFNYSFKLRKVSIPYICINQKDGKLQGVYIPC